MFLIMCSPTHFTIYKTPPGPSPSPSPTPPKRLHPAALPHAPLQLLSTAHPLPLPPPRLDRLLLVLCRTEATSLLLSFCFTHEERVIPGPVCVELRQWVREVALGPGGVVLAGRGAFAVGLGGLGVRVVRLL